jgi:hypothetical protein
MQQLTRQVGRVAELLLAREGPGDGGVGRGHEYRNEGRGEGGNLGGCERGREGRNEGGNEGGPGWRF